MTRGLEPSRAVTLLLSAMLAFAPAAAGASPEQGHRHGNQVKGANMWFVQGNATAVRTIRSGLSSPAQR
jgi:hypothetical protein